MKKIAVISCWWNEEKLAKLFLKAHDYADKIFILMADDATDRSREIALANKKVVIESLNMPNGFDDQIKIDAINTKARSFVGKFDWVVSMDSDEFPNPDIRSRIDGAKLNELFNVEFYTLYRHRTEKEFDPDGELSQRQHGVWMWTKPCVLAVKNNMEWTTGCHCVNNSKMFQCPTGIIKGGHWNSASPEIAIDRRIRGRRDRMSQVNIEKTWGSYNYNVTEQQIIDECNIHLDDPLEIQAWSNK